MPDIQVERKCPVCSTELPVDAHWRRVFCGTKCRGINTRRQALWRYQNDPEYREKHLGYKRDLILFHPTYRVKKNEQARDRYATDPELREKLREKCRQYYVRNREHLKRASRMRHHNRRRSKDYRQREEERQQKHIVHFDKKGKAQC